MDDLISFLQTYHLRIYTQFLNNQIKQEEINRETRFLSLVQCAHTDYTSGLVWAFDSFSKDKKTMLLRSGAVLFPVPWDQWWMVWTVLAKEHHKYWQKNDKDKEKFIYEQYGVTCTIGRQRN